MSLSIPKDNIIDLSALITIIIPTHKRHSYLKRSIKYFKDFLCKVIYVDSSPEGFFHFPDSVNLEYRHMAGSSFVDKVLATLEIITTDYVILCADDDFVCESALLNGVEFLDHNRHYNTYLGEIIGFYDEFDGEFYRGAESPIIDVNSSSKDNIKQFFKFYRNVLWSINKKNNLLKVFSILQEGKFSNDNFIEFTISVISCYTGGVYFSKDYLNVRELSNQVHWGDKQKTLLEIHSSNEMKKDFRVFKKIVDTTTESGYSKFALNCYIRSRGTSIFKLRLKSLIKKIFKRFSGLKIPQSYQSAANKYAGLNKIKVFDDLTCLNKLVRLLSEQTN